MKDKVWGRLISCLLLLDGHGQAESLKMVLTKTGGSVTIKLWGIPYMLCRYWQRDIIYISQDNKNIMDI